MLRRTMVVAALWGLLAASVALAQSQYLSPNGQPAPLNITGCVDASNRAVPCSTTTPLITGGAGSTASQSNAAATGTAADAAYAGTGSSTVIAALKGIYARLAGTLTVATSPNRGTALKANTSLGTTATALIPAGAARSFWMVQNQSSTATLMCSLDGTTPVTGSAGFMVVSLGNRAQDGAAGRFMAVGALTCVASAAATPVYVEYLQ